MLSLFTANSTGPEAYLHSRVAAWKHMFNRLWVSCMTLPQFSKAKYNEIPISDKNMILSLNVRTNCLGHTQVITCTTVIDKGLVVTINVPRALRHTTSSTVQWKDHHDCSYDPSHYVFALQRSLWTISQVCMLH